MLTEQEKTLQEKLKNLPARPGCYVFHAEGGEVLYVGKALSLRNRVRSYFQTSAKHGSRIARLVQKTRDLEWIVVDSELEALVLECNLIKQYRPSYNVRLRDDKSYPYITITKEGYPRLLFTRRPKRDGGRYFGPYASAWAVRDTLQLLHKVFPLIPCGKSWSGREEQRPCLYYHLGQCLAPCAGLSDKAEYKKVIDQVERFLEGKYEGIVEDLEKKMNAAAEALEFEQAALYRDRIQSIEKVLERQKVLSEDGEDRDIIAVVKDERNAAIQMLYVRGGKLIGQRQFILDGSAESAPGEAVQEFVKQYYSDAPEVPREVLLPVEIEEQKIVQQWLRQRRGSAVTLGVPRGGEKLKLVEMAAANAEHALKSARLEMEQKEAWAEQALLQLTESLGLPSPPRRVEGYDISNIQGTAPVGSMVVMIDGQPAKAEYRRFKIRYHPESPNDFAMMNETVMRRLRAYLNGDPKFAQLPDLILIDGGKGQLSAALKARDELGLTVPMVGLAKRMELLYVPIEERGEITVSSNLTLEDRHHSEGFPTCRDEPKNEKRARANRTPTQPPPGSLRLPTSPSLASLSKERHCPPPKIIAPISISGPDERIATGKLLPDKTYSYEELELPLNSSGLHLLQNLRDEAHRFALTFHRKLRDKRLAGSELDEIPGVGPRRRRMLLRTFGSIAAIRRASIDEIAAVPTMTRRLAEQVVDYFRDLDS